MKRDTIINVCSSVGAACIIAGVAWIHLPSGLIALGVILLGFAALLVFADEES